MPHLLGHLLFTVFIIMSSLIILKTSKLNIYVYIYIYIYIYTHCYSVIDFSSSFSIVSVCCVNIAFFLLFACYLDMFMCI